MEKGCLELKGLNRMIYASRLEYLKKRSKQHDWSKGNALKKSLPGRQKAELMNLIVSLFPAASDVAFRKKKVVCASLWRVPVCVCGVPMFFAML